MTTLRPALVLAVSTIAGGVLAILPSTASASILTSAPQSVKCGEAIEVGVWNRPDGNPPASRRVTLRIKSARGKTIATRTVTAKSSWRYYTYTGRCGRTYRVSFTNPQFGTSTQKVRVRD